MGNILDRETMGPQTKRVHNWISWTLTALLFIAVLLYAGFRGYVAHKNLPSERITFAPRSSIPFPVVTMCPFVPVPVMNIVECELELNGNPVGDCYGTITTQMFSVEGQPRSCFVINTQGTLNSDQNADELAIQVYINSTLLPAYEPVLGVFVLINAPNQPTILKTGSSFIADGGKLTEAYIRMDETHHLNKSVSTTYSASPSAASNRDPKMVDTIDVDFWFTDQGAFIHQEYVAYNVDNWIGEVGGFTCLLTFLHMAVLWIIMAIYRQAKPESRANKLNEGTN